MTATDARFIESFIPENYNLFLDINRSEKTFTGNVAITGEAIDNHISLHQKDLTINSVLLDNESLNFQMDDANEAFHIELPETGVLTIFIEFSGRITDNMTGIYPSYYTYNGEKKEIISTQFESHFAREAFPCVDEPEAKATFDLSLKFDAEEGDTALSNMPGKRRDQSGGKNDFCGLHALELAWCCKDNRRKVDIDLWNVQMHGFHIPRLI